MQKEMKHDETKRANSDSFPSNEHKTLKGAKISRSSRNFCSFEGSGYLCFFCWPLLGSTFNFEGV